MNVVLFGISHHTAPIELRERLAIAEESLPRVLEALAAWPGVAEGMVLSTCNRVEILARGDGSHPDLRGFLLSLQDADWKGTAEHFYEHRDEAAIRHLFRVAASLDSLVVGEPQILGQLKAAYGAAQAAGVIGSELGLLVARALFAAKRVRTETEIAAQPVSVSHAAVDLARQIFGDLSGKTVLLIGAGAMGELAARYLMESGAARLLVANRTLERARIVAAKFGGEALPLEQLAQYGEQADVLISCTGSPHPVVTRDEAQRFLARRRQRPMLFLDVAVPRDIEPSVHGLENAFVYNVDDLETVVRSNRSEREREAVMGEAIIEAEVVKFAHRRQERQLAPTLRALQARAEGVRAGEWERMRKRLGPLSAEQEAAVEALTRGLMRKWLHHPMVEIKGAAGGEAGDGMLELVRRLFDLDRGAEEGAAPTGAKGGEEERR